MSNKAKWLAALLVAACGLGAWVWTMRLQPLDLAVARDEQRVPVELFGLGTVEAHVVARFGFKQPGTLVELAVDHGDAVAEGAVLARIDSREQRARARKSQSGVASAEAAVLVAQAMASRSGVVHVQRQQANQRRQALLARGTISIEQAEEAQLTEATAKADLTVAEAEVVAARARLDDARAQHAFEDAVLNQHELRAPFAGVVIARAKELGAVAGAGETIFTLVDPATYWILAYLDEARTGAVALAQPARIRLRSQPGREFTGRVVRIGLEADRVNEERRVHVKCEDCPANGYVLGEQAEVIIRTGEMERATLVPETAIDGLTHGRGGVWVIAGGKLVRRELTFGRRTLDGRHEVLDLAAGEQIVTERHPRIHPGRAATASVRP